MEFYIILRIFALKMGFKRKYSDDIIEQFVKLRKQGETLQKISDITCATISGLRIYLNKAGLEKKFINGVSPQRKEIKYELNERGCHICTSHPTSSGYPSTERNGKKWRLHRYIYTQAYGEIPKGLFVTHNCDNKLCINLNHLKLGTLQENNREYRDRIFKPKYTQEMIEEICNSQVSAYKLAKVIGLSKQTILKIRKSTKK